MHCFKHGKYSFWMYFGLSFSAALSFAGGPPQNDPLHALTDACAKEPNNHQVVVESLRENLAIPLAQAQQAWHPRYFTDPAHHNDQKFQYLLSGVLEEAEQRLYAKRTFDSSTSAGVDIWKHPERIHERPFISASLVNNQVRETWADSGFILSVPDQNVFASGGGDIGSPTGNLSHGQSLTETLMAYRDAWGLWTPTQITQMNRSRRRPSYTEVLLTGTTKGSDNVERRIQISGLFVIVDEEGKPRCSKTRTKEIRERASRMNLPIVFIKRP